MQLMQRSWRVLLVFCAALTLGLAAFAAAPHARAATTFFVSRNGNNTDGHSWATAWNNLDQINWTAVSAGDTIFIDGGSTACPSNYDFTSTRPGVVCGMLYNRTLTIGKSGTATAPITIKLASDSGHNGTAVFFGGRTTPLPYCTQASYAASSSGTRYATGIVADGAQYVTVDGGRRSGIMVYGYDLGTGAYSTGIRTTSNTAFDTFRNLEIFDNGIPTTISGGYNSDDPGVRLWGHNLTFDQNLIHDNGQDEFQGAGQNGNPVNNITIKNSWMYEHRMNPKYPGFGFNGGPHSAGCTHADGIQIYGGGGQSGLTFDYNIFGPYLMQGIYPSDIGTYYNNVSVTHSLILGNYSNNVNVDAQSPSTYPSNWQFTNDTLYDMPSNPDPSGYGWTNLNLHSGSQLTFNASIFANGNGALPSGQSGSGNIYYSTRAVPGGTNTNPLFTSALTTATPAWSTWASSNFTPGCTGCSGKGSPLHSFGDLTARIDSLNSSSQQSGSPTLQSSNVTPANASVTAGSTQQYAATGTFSDGSQQNLTSTATWSTSDSAVATINSSGLLTAVAPGTTTVRAMQSGITGSTTVTVTSVTAPSGTPPSGTNGLSFTADKGIIAPPFAWTAGSPGNVSQTTSTAAGGPAAGGQASYVFNVATAGTYTLNVQLSAADAASNSVYLNVDAAPNSDTQIFDTPTTTGFQAYAASSRGSGGSTYITDQYVPVMWTLTAGTHTLYVSGREANTRIASFTFVQQAGSVTSSTSFTDHALSPTQTGSFELTYDVMPVASTSGGVVGQSQNAAAAYTDLATSVAFETTGVIDARNGGAYQAATTVNWVANHAYHFRLDIRIASHTYDIYVTPPGGSEIALGSSYAFRTEQQSSTSLGRWTAVTTQGGTYSNLIVCNATMH